MQKKRKKRGLMVLVVLICSGIIGLDIWFCLQKEKALPVQAEKEIASFHYEFGSFHGGYYFYEIEKKEEIVFLTAEGQNGVELDVAKEIEGKRLQEIQKLIEQYKIKNWNGFSRRKRGILDGYSFALEIQYEDGTTITAMGYEKYPKEYWEWQKEIEAYLEHLAIA